jgi:AcrR family transcriptional regulator
MARVVKEEEHAVKRKEIVAAARQLVFTKGYEQMSVQDIVDTLQISKGAFYHYFDSKPALLEGLLEVLIAEGVALLNPIVTDPQLPAVEKLRRYFDAAGRWKTEQKELLLAFLRVWYKDDNAIVRQKQLAMALKRIAPMLAAIIQQGVDEGVFTTRYPEQLAPVVLCLWLSAGDAWAEMLLSPDPPPDAREQIERLVAAYSEAFERVLGAPAGSLTLVDAQLIEEWLPTPRVTAGVTNTETHRNGHG